MIRLGARIAEGIQLSDYTPDMMPHAMQNVTAGLAKRETPINDFRVGNFWAFHVKEDPEISMYEARRERIWRGAIAAKYEHELRPHLDSDEEVQLVIDNWDNFFKAFYTRTGDIDNVPEEIVNSMIEGMSSTGGFDVIDRDLELGFDQSICYCFALVIVEAIWPMQMGW